MTVIYKGRKKKEKKMSLRIKEKHIIFITSKICQHSTHGRSHHAYTSDHPSSAPFTDPSSPSLEPYANTASSGVPRPTPIPCARQTQAWVGT
jgi:hypothetical protein